MTPKPSYHPHAERLAEFLVAAFAAEAPAILAGFHLALASPHFMRGLEALCFVHETTSDPDMHIRSMREGMRLVALTVEAARYLQPGDLKEALDAHDKTGLRG